MKTSYLKNSLVLAACLVGTMYANAQQTKPETLVQYTTQADGNREQMHTVKNGKNYQLEFVNDQLTALTIDGVAIPKEKWGQYDAFIKEMREQLKRDREQAEKDRIQAAKDREQAGKDRVQAEKDRAQAKLDRAQADKDREQAVRDREQAQLNRVQAEKDRQQAVKDRQQADLDRVQADKDRAQAEKDREQAEKDREQAQKDRVQAEKDRATAAQDRKLLENLTEELVSDKLITDSKALHEFILNNTGMSVNGEKQPERVAKKYQEKYSRFAKAGITYRVSGTTRQYSTSGVLEAE
ncbi:E3 ubiquitin-protein ligase DOA10 [Filimonas zeae]|uniref:TolA protein n=1 Tax=Filimonas zeae TaxID=1737353 RepID=A0A917IRG6_9BACT|nr:hypothetical protein [Filimonas zeae]MDR6338059.1 E3 ubiquitin-protein ligase DOA10 [Filimonas zeae]GGH61510.1 hypothetical protein GCM10011379_10570 [Filimonas zeae]